MLYFCMHSLLYKLYCIIHQRIFQQRNLPVGVRFHLWIAHNVQHIKHNLDKKQRNNTNWRHKMNTTAELSALNVDHGAL